LVIKRNFNVQFTHKELYIAGTAGLTPGITAIAISSCASPSAGKKEDEGQVIFIGDNIALEETSYGNVRGFIHKDIYNFLGIQYGANTSGKKRIMAAQKPEPWTDIYPAVYWP
jgi:para-nitrobenzyl esterase